MANETDKEQVEQLKKWFKDYGLSIVLALILGLGLGIGWHTYQEYKKNQLVRTESDYSNLLLSYAQVEEANSSEKQALQKKFFAGAKHFVQENSGSTYVDLTNLLLAKAYVEEKNYPSALQALANVIDSKEAFYAIKQLAKIRAVRILRELKRYQQALALLNNQSENAGAFNAVLNQLKSSLADF